jgi:hypothetical protein
LILSYTDPKEPSGVSHVSKLEIQPDGSLNAYQNDRKNFIRFTNLRGFIDKMRETKVISIPLYLTDFPFTSYFERPQPRHGSYNLLDVKVTF